MSCPQPAVELAAVAEAGAAETPFEAEWWRQFGDPASRRAAELARIQYREGAVAFLRLLDAERAVLVGEATVATAETDVTRPSS